MSATVTNYSDLVQSFKSMVINATPCKEALKVFLKTDATKIMSEDAIKTILGKFEATQQFGEVVNAAVEQSVMGRLSQTGSMMTDSSHMSGLSRASSYQGQTPVLPGRTALSLQKDLTRRSISNSSQSSLQASNGSRPSSGQQDSRPSSRERRWVPAGIVGGGFLNECRYQLGEIFTGITGFLFYILFIYRTAKNENIKDFKAKPEPGVSEKLAAVPFNKLLKQPTDFQFDEDRLFDEDRSAEFAKLVTFDQAENIVTNCIQFLILIFKDLYIPDLIIAYLKGPDCKGADSYINLLQKFGTNTDEMRMATKEELAELKIDCVPPDQTDTTPPALIPKLQKIKDAIFAFNQQKYTDPRKASEWTDRIEEAQKLKEDCQEINEDINGLVRVYVKINNKELTKDTYPPTIEYQSANGKDYIIKFIDTATKELRIKKRDDEEELRKKEEEAKREQMGGGKCVEKYADGAPFPEYPANKFKKVFYKQTNKEIYNDEFQNLFKQLLLGYKLVIFGYGYSGSGKTFTLLNCNKNDKVGHETDEYGLLLQFLMDQPLMKDVSEIYLDDQSLLELYKKRDFTIGKEARLNAVREMRTPIGNPLQISIGLLKSALLFIANNLDDKIMVNLLTIDTLSFTKKIIIDEIKKLFIEDGKFFFKYQGVDSSPEQLVKNTTLLLIAIKFIRYNRTYKFNNKAPFKEYTIKRFGNDITLDAEKLDYQQPTIKWTINNKESSRSHLFLTFIVKTTDQKTGKLTIIDMGGAEKETEVYQQMKSYALTVPTNLDDILANPQKKGIFLDMPATTGSHSLNDNLILTVNENSYKLLDFQDKEYFNINTDVINDEKICKATLYNILERVFLFGKVKSERPDMGNISDNVFLLDSKFLMKAKNSYNQPILFENNQSSSYTKSDLDGYVVRDEALRLLRLFGLTDVTTAIPPAQNYKLDNFLNDIENAGYNKVNSMEPAKIKLNMETHITGQAKILYEQLISSQNKENCKKYFSFSNNNFQKSVLFPQSVPTITDSQNTLYFTKQMYLYDILEEGRFINNTIYFLLIYLTLKNNALLNETYNDDSFLLVKNIPSKIFAIRDQYYNFSNITKNAIKQIDKKDKTIIDVLKAIDSTQIITQIEEILKDSNGTSSDLPTKFVMIANVTPEDSPIKRETVRPTLDFAQQLHCYATQSGSTLAKQLQKASAAPLVAERSRLGQAQGKSGTEVAIPAGKLKGGPLPGASPAPGKLKGAPVASSVVRAARR